MLIAFLNDNFCKRGTENALYDYAHYNEKILGNKSIVISPSRCLLEDQESIMRFRQRFPLFFFQNEDELVELIRECSILYYIKSGDMKNNWYPSVKEKLPNIRIIVHCVFNCGDPHGDIYLPISRCIAERYGVNDFVPHMITIHEEKNEIYERDLREELKIPQDSIVFGRYGGYDSFDLHFVHKVIQNIVIDQEEEEDNDRKLYFLFMNTENFLYHQSKYCIFLPGTVDVGQKYRFIKTCDAMIHGRLMGESFGIACGEFNVLGRPVFTYNNSRDREHIKILGKEAILYQDDVELETLLKTFQRHKADNMYLDYTPEKVMTVFKDKFLSNMTQRICDSEQFRTNEITETKKEETKKEETKKEKDLSKGTLIISFGSYDPISLYKMKSYYGADVYIASREYKNVPDENLEHIPYPQNLLANGYLVCRGQWYNMLNTLRQAVNRAKGYKNVIYCTGNTYLLFKPLEENGTLNVSPIVYMGSDYRGHEDNSIDYHFGYLSSEDFIKMFTIDEEDLGWIFRRSGDIEGIINNLRKRSQLKLHIIEDFEKFVYNGSEVRKK